MTRFITLLGWDRVRRAAETTARRDPKEVIDPWAYMVGIINRSSARASYLYTLFHWIELALRASVDCAFADRFGADWHRLDPPVYLAPAARGRLTREYQDYKARESARGYTRPGDEPRIRWTQDVVTQTWLPDYESPEDFLAALEFETLTEIVLYAYEVRDARMAPILFAGNGEQMPVHSAREELKWLRKFVRTYVAHNRPDELASLGETVTDLNEYVAKVKRTERVLLALRYNLIPALARHEQKRMAVVDEAVKRLGGKGLVVAISDLKRGTA